MVRFRNIFIALVLVLLPVQAAFARNQERKVEITGGVEWGYTATFFQNHCYIFYTDDGMRVDMIGGSFDYASNGHMQARLGLRFFDHFDFTFGLGWYGIQDSRNLVSYALRFGYYYKGFRNNTVFNFIEAGEGGAPTFELQPIYVFKLGVGYRFKISDDLSLDASISYQLSEDHPKNIIDYAKRSEIYYHQLRRSDIFNSAINFSLAINF